MSTPTTESTATAGTTNDANDALESRLAAVEAQTGADRARLRRAERRLRATWALALTGVVGAFALGYHTDAVAQTAGTTLEQLSARLSAVEDKTQDMARLTDPTTGQPTVRFSGVNVQVVSGSGFTFGETNGRGNLIIGYNELAGSVGGIVRTGSHNLVVGTFNNYTSYGGIVAGIDNLLTGKFASVTGGARNNAAGSYSSVSGGQWNRAGGDYSAISGGPNRTISSDSGWVAGRFTGTTYSGNFSSQ
jgi:hypothetical protein